ncbi:MAG: hypothetical protein K8I27_06455 [Planctomycetes bacterium]|nr:hypothetical protein [Planctomycetota bacterium]
MDYDEVRHHQHRLVVAWALWKRAEGCTPPFPQAEFREDIQGANPGDVNRLLLEDIWQEVSRSIGSQGLVLDDRDLDFLTGRYQVHLWTFEQLADDLKIGVGTTDWLYTMDNIQASAAQNVASGVGYVCSLAAVVAEALEYNAANCDQPGRHLTVRCLLHV